MTPSEISRFAQSILPLTEQLLREWLPAGRKIGREWVVGSLQNEPGQSCRTNLDTGRGADFATGDRWGDPVALYAKLRSLTQSQAVSELSVKYPAARPNGPLNDSYPRTEHINGSDGAPLPQAQNFDWPLETFHHSYWGIPEKSNIWYYRDEAGHPQFVVARYYTPGGKQYCPWTWDGLRWQPKGYPQPRPLYGLKQLAAMPDQPVLIVEGEKTADAAQRYWPNRPSITWSGGAAAVRTADWTPLRGRIVRLLPDNDDPGRNAMVKLAEILLPLGCQASIVDWRDFPGAREGWDIADAEQEGRTAQELTQYANAHLKPCVPAITSEREPDPAPEPPQLDRDPAQRTSIVSGEPRNNGATLEIRDSDVANAKRFAARHGKDLKFTPERGWYVWDNRRWALDDKVIKAQALAKETAIAIFDEIRDAPDRDAHMRHAKRSQSKNSIEAMIWLTRSEPGIATRLTDFDQDGWLLNVANGTINLRTGQIRPHAREDLISNIVDVNHDPIAGFELWDTFLWRVTGHSEELYAYLRRFVGYLLVGDTSDQSLHFLYGLGANGKSVFCEVLMRLLGGYAIAVSPDLLMLRRHGGIPNDVARLRGVRAVLMNETTQGARFDEAKLKDLTGGDTLTARFLHQEFFDFRPTHRIVMRGNHKPAINGTDEGIWRRLRLVPFTVTIPEDERDQHLLAKLEAELPGILNWALQGCREWQAEGLKPPSAITDAVRAYREESDTLGRFIAECCEVRKLGQVKSSALFRRYQEFAEQAGERWIPSKDLPHEMQRRGYNWKRTKAGGIYEGLELQGPAIELPAG